MSMTQFAMVEELAFLVKDNLHCKHLVLTMEETLVKFLQDDDTRAALSVVGHLQHLIGAGSLISDGILELEPMNSYNRLLLHRLAEIFGFAHESVGEGDDRHLILGKCPDTSIPPILVSDILWKYDEPLSLITSHQILRREEASPASQANRVSFQQSLEERKAAYLVARERIFSESLEEVKEPVEQKPRSVPVVARRMIAHALGQRIHMKNQNGLATESMQDRVLTDELNAQGENSRVSNLMEDSEESVHLRRNSNSRRNTTSSNGALLNKRNDQIPPDKDLPTQDGKQGRHVSKEYMEKEHIGAAKRMFAHALGVQSGKDGSVPRSRGAEIRKN